MKESWAARVLHLSRWCWVGLWKPPLAEDLLAFIHPACPTGLRRNHPMGHPRVGVIAAPWGPADWRAGGTCEGKKWGRWELGG